MRLQHNIICLWVVPVDWGDADSLIVLKQVGMQGAPGPAAAEVHVWYTGMWQQHLHIACGA
jgi:hypothetical protein